MRLVHFVQAGVQGVALLLGMSLRLPIAPALIATISCGRVVAREADSAAPTRSYHLPRGDAATMLRQFAAISGVPVLFMMDKVKDEQTNAVDGDYSPAHALERMLAGTALEIATPTDTEGFAVRRRVRPPHRAGVMQGDASTSTMNNSPTRTVGTNKLRAWFAHVALAVTAAAANAQPNAASAAASRDEIIRLEDFQVTASGASGYRATNSITATGIGARIGDTPSTISVVTKDLITDTRTDLINDALRFVPGVVTSPLNESQPFVRGFQGTYTLRNGMFRRQNLLTFNVDRVEVIQGPSSIFYSNIRPGGVINYVTAKPVMNRMFVDTTVSAGNYDYLRGEAAFNAGNDKFAVRVDLGSLSTKSFRRNFTETQRYISFAFNWQLTPNQLLTFEAADEETDRRNTWSAYLAPWTNSRYWMNPAAIASGQSLSAFMAANYPGVPVYDMFAPFLAGTDDPYDRVTPVMRDSFARNSDKPIDVTYTAKLTDQLVFSVMTNYAWEEADGVNVITPGDILANGTWSGVAAQTEYFKNVRDSYNANWRFTYRTKFGSTTNTAMVGNDNQWVTLRTPVVNGSSNQRSPSAPFDPRNGVILYGGAYQQSTAPINSLRDTLQYFQGTYVVDQISWKDTLFATAGLRYTNFKQHIHYPYRPDLSAQPDAVAKKSTPQVGVLYKLPQGVSLFGTYSESVIPQTQIDASGRAVNPITAKGWDAGVKTDLLGGALTSTIDYYEINENNVAIVDQAANLAHGLPAGQTVFAYYTYGNAQRVRGAQIDLNFNISDSYQLIVGANHFFEADFVAPQSNPLNVGVALPYQPKDTVSVWNRYQAKSGPLSGLILGGGFRHNAAASAGGNFNNSTMIFPAFTVWDGLVGYNAKIGHRDVQFRLNVKNVFDKIYRDSGAFGQSRTFILSASTRF